jgi:type IV pilus assembly protein PilB
MLATVGMPVHLIKNATVHRAVGCAVCSNTGYRGRVALHEAMEVTDRIEQALVGRATGGELREIALEQGMIPLRDDGWAKVAQGITTIEEILRVSV